MCLIWNYYTQNLEMPRFVWMGGRGLGAEAPAEDDWDEPDLDSAYDKERKAGKGRSKPPFQLPNAPTPGPGPGPEKPKTIDPGPVVINPKTGKPMEKLEDRFPRLLAVVQKLYEIGNEEFWNQNLGAIAGKYAADYIKVAEKMPEAMLYKAITENWTQETLYEKYRQAMGDLYTKAASRPLLKEAWGQTKRAWHWATESENPGAPGMNMAIEGKRKISLREKPKVLAKMMQLENELINGDDVCLEWNGKCKDWEDDDDLDEDRLEFIREEMVAFYREWFLNKAIVEDKTTNELLWAYAKALGDFGKSCEIP
ncbi:hypothetical protein HYW83_04175 [Candidatus Peregrinibacteria bacterium]|nr:hypothetical protein [Candidatus Peregrinibacteria bacterium]